MDSENLYAQALRAFLKPIINFVDDPTVSEIMINGAQEVWIERGGKLYKTEAKFSEDGLIAAARNIAQYVGRPLDEERAILDARLPDGSRICILLSPVSRKGTVIAIRKFIQETLSIESLIKFGSLSRKMAQFLKACVVTKKNLIISGGTSSGKTTFLNVLSNYIPDQERIVTIEDSQEVQLQKSHLVPLEARPPNNLGKGEITIRDLLKASLRLRPDRIIIGEVRGEEAFDLIQAMNTGHGGSICTAHASTPIETCRRLESLCLMSNIDLPLIAVRAQVAAAINLILCTQRFNDGSRKITHISEMLPLNKNGEYQLRQLFTFITTGKDSNGKVEGYYTTCGEMPTFLEQLQIEGFHQINQDFFKAQTPKKKNSPIDWSPREESPHQPTIRESSQSSQSNPEDLDDEKTLVGIKIPNNF